MNLSNWQPDIIRKADPYQNKSARHQISLGEHQNTINSKHKPLGIILVSGFYTFGAIVLLIGLFINPIQVNSSIAERHGLPPTTGSWFLLVITGLALIMAWGLFSLSLWGYGLNILGLLSPILAFMGIFLWPVVGFYVFKLVIKHDILAPLQQARKAVESDIDTPDKP
jgi:hypothetical protein